MVHRFLFVLCPPFCGSTLLARLLATSPEVAHLHMEGQLLDEVKEVMLEKPWDPTFQMPWEHIKEVWMGVWDLNKAVLGEKSPPHLMRAEAIQKVFRPAFFVAKVRDPYAACEGATRRTGMTWEAAASYWVRFARRQLRNRDRLDRVLLFTYEDLADHPDATRDRILDFLPELEQLDLDRNFEAHTVHGYGEHPIANYNRDKIARMTDEAFPRINPVLAEHRDVMDAFGYRFLARGEDYGSNR